MYQATTLNLNCLYPIIVENWYCRKFNHYLRLYMLTAYTINNCFIKLNYCTTFISTTTTLISKKNMSKYCTRSSFFSGFCRIPVINPNSKHYTNAGQLILINTIAMTPKSPPNFIFVSITILNFSILLIVHHCTFCNHLVKIFYYIILNKLPSTVLRVLSS